MDTLKAAQFEEISKAIHQKWGQQALQTARALQKNKKRAVIPTSFSGLDAALGIGGLPCGEITLLEGNPTSGMTSLAYRLIRSAQKHGLVSVYLDLSQTFDAEYAIRQHEIDEEKLLLVYPDDLAHALALARDVIPLPYLGVIVVDAGLVSIASAFPTLLSGLSRLKSPLKQSRWTLLGLLSQDNRWSTLTSSLHLKITRTKWQYSNTLLSGLWASVQINKNVHHPSAKTADISIEFGDDLS